MMKNEDDYDEDGDSRGSGNQDRGGGATEETVDAALTR